MTKKPTIFDLWDAKPEPTITPRVVTHIDPARANRYATVALEGECEIVATAANGTRNATLNKAAFRMGRHVGAGSIDADTVREALANAARATGLPEDEIQTVLRDQGGGVDAGAEVPRHPTPQDPIPSVTVLTDTDPGPPLNPPLDWHELFARDGEGEEWIIEPILPARRMVALYSAPKAGKSLLMLELAVAMARGTAVLGGPLDRPYRVLYIDFENDPEGDILTRLEAMGQKPDDLDNLVYLSFPSLAKFDTEQGALDLMRHIEHYECEVVVIDTVSRAVAGEENENDTWLKFYRHAGLSLKRAGIACIRLDHSGKDREKGMRGGSAKYGDVDAVWRLTALNENTISLECTDNRMPVPVTSLTLVRQDFPLSHVPAGDAWQAATDAKTRSVDEKLDHLLVPHTASVREATRALREAGEKFENRAIREAVKMRKLVVDLPIPDVYGQPAGRSAVAWEEARRMLSDGSWWSRGEVIEAMVRTSDVVAKSCSNRLSEAVTAGVIEQRGQYPEWEIRALPGGVPGTPPAHPGTPEVSVPGTAPPVRGRPAHLGGVPGTPSEDEDELVSCKRCFHPTSSVVAGKNDGLCSACATTEETTP